MIDEWIKKLCYVYTILLNHKRDTFESVLVRWMNLEPIIQSEVREKQILYINTHVYMKSRKMVLMNLFAGKE